MKDISKEWLIAASDDLEVINRLIKDNGLTHMVAFHAQQCVEKCLKFIIEERELESFKIHNLRRLFDICDHYVSFSDEDLDLIILLDTLYIEARYPGELGLLPNGKPSSHEACQFMEFAQKVFNHCHSLFS
jgi:HEPN domain-containing protein